MSCLLKKSVCDACAGPQACCLVSGPGLRCSRLQSQADAVLPAACAGHLSTTFAVLLAACAGRLSTKYAAPACRPVTKDAIRNLETALASAGSASSVLVDLTRAAARNAAGEMQAAEALRDIMTLKGSTSTSSGLAVDHLDEAIKRAARFPHLSVSACPCTSSPRQAPLELARASKAADLHHVPVDVLAAPLACCTGCRLCSAVAGPSLMLPAPGGARQLRADLQTLCLRLRAWQACSLRSSVSHLH